MIAYPYLVILFLSNAFRITLPKQIATSSVIWCFRSPLAIILADSNGIIRDANPSTEALIGYKKAEIVGRSFVNLSIVHQDHLPIIMKRIEQQFKGLKEPAFDIQFYHKDGRVLWATIISTLIKFGDESFLQVLAHDITEQKQQSYLLKRR